MASASERIIDYDGTFFRGAKSDADPGQVPLGYYWMGINVINTGGVLSCRPGMRCKVQLPDGNLQGAAIFRPIVGLEHLVVAVDGRIYVAEYPFTNFRLLPNVQMSPHAKQMYWALTTQSARRLSNDFASGIEIIDSRAVLFIQDGGHTAPAFYDGSESGHIRDLPFETPAGGPMAWVGDRLWVAVRNRVFASDISNPFSFRETVYLGGVSAFEFVGDVTAMTAVPGVEITQLIVFTDTNASILQANVRNRDQWPTINEFQKEILQVGCPSQRSLVSHFGSLSWFSPNGIVFLDSARAGKITTRTPIRDNEMLRSKVTLYEDLSLVASAAFGQYLMNSVPAEDVYNKHTWVLNHASLETLSDDSGPSWCGFWLGTRPVEWVYGNIGGAERIYHVSKDEDGVNRLWECFLSDRLDNGCPIMWAVETRGYFGQTSELTKKVPGSDCKMGWAEIALTAIDETLDLGVFYAGGVRGAFKQILAKQISVERGSIRSGVEITATTRLVAFKAQARLEVTEDASQQSIETDTGSCPPESSKTEHLDESFQLLIVGHGPASIRRIRVFGFSMPENLSGDPNACIDETPFNAVRFDGEGVRTNELADAVAQMGAREIRNYTSNKTTVLTQLGFTEVGVGHSESIVSQNAADRVAQTIAERDAEFKLAQVVPHILSAGLDG